uniref:Carbohydrate sulfotransferase n=1 Tax=Salmo trutta TaxID=8032 RepID=A0A674B3X9_SALTR
MVDKVIRREGGVGGRGRIQEGGEVMESDGVLHQMTLVGGVYLMINYSWCDCGNVKDLKFFHSPDLEYLIKCRGEEMSSNPSFLIPSPRQPPSLQWLPHPVTPTSGDPAESSRSLVTKRHRKLLLKNGSLTPSRTPTGEEYHRLQVCSKYQPGVTEHPVSCLQVFRVFMEDRHCNYKCLCSYTKVLFVWEPLEGLVSAFCDKFERSNWYYHSAFGRPIISQYRAKASLSALRTGDGVTFRDMDIHSIGCLPTSRQKGLLPPLLRYTLNSTERQRVYDLYYMDYLMFKYPKPFLY